MLDQICTNMKPFQLGLVLKHNLKSYEPLVKPYLPIEQPTATTPHFLITMHSSDICGTRHSSVFEVQY